MGYINHGTRVSLPSDRIPVGFTAPAVTPFTDAEFKPRYTLTVAKATVETASRADTLLAIIEDVTVGVQQQVETNLSSKLNTTGLDVNVWIDLRNIDSNDKPANDNDFYTNAADLYYTTVDVYIKFTALP